MATESPSSGPSERVAFGIRPERMRRARWLVVLVAALAGAFHVSLYASGAGPAFLVVGVAFLLAGVGFLAAALRVAVRAARRPPSPLHGTVTAADVARWLVERLPPLEVAVAGRPLRTVFVLVLASLLEGDEPNDAPGR